MSGAIHDRRASLMPASDKNRESIVGLPNPGDEAMVRTEVHVTLTPIVFMFGALLITNRMGSGLTALVVMLGAAVLEVLYGWRNRHR
jgi:hypothetical protein